MRKIILFIAMCLLGFASLSHGATELVNIESAGQVVIEAEDFTSRSDINGQSWEIVPAESPGFPSEYANYRGTGYIQLLPDLELGTWGPPVGTVVPPGVNYKVRISTVGTYRLYVRMDGNSGSSDSFYASIAELSDGTGGTIADWYRYVLANDMDFATLPWQGMAGFERLDAVGSEVAATWDITAPGDYTIRIIRREDGTALDTLILQLDSLPAPTSTGPVASATVSEPYTIPVGSACTTPSPDMVSWWPGDFNANDIVGGNDGTLTNGAYYTKDSAVGLAFILDGVDDYVAAPSVAPLIKYNQITIEAWVQPSAYNDPAWCCAHIIGLDSAGWMTHIGMDPTNPYLWTNNGIYVRDPDPLIIGAWQHIAATYDGTTAKFYTNGVLKSSQNIAVTLPIGDATMIGASKTVQLRQFAGSIDEVKIFNRALTDKEILGIYLAGDKGHCKSGTPIADAGPDQTVHLGTVVNLDGSGSTDPDGDYPLTYQWKSVLKLTNPDSVSPSFKASTIGDFEINLVVVDSNRNSSVVDTVLISTYNSAPVADAGPDQAVTLVNTLVQLDATQSYDPDGDRTYYLWGLLQVPAGSAASLSNYYSPTPTFVADVKGTYTFSLNVSDIWKGISYDQVVVSFDNIIPVANAGGNQAITLGDVIVVNGITSTDANNDPLTYSWSLVSKPAASAITGLTPIDLTMAEFTPDAAGSYVVSLIVNDGTVDSLPYNITVTVTSVEDAAIDTLQDIVGTINTMDPDWFINKNLGKAATNKIGSIITMINDAISQSDLGLYQEAVDKLENDLLKKTDGCANTGAKDNNDWINACEGQALVYPLIMEAIDLINRLL